ncbi:MAG: flagellar assembly protein FliX [Beijerinckiaceae bacterium]
MRVDSRSPVGTAAGTSAKPVRTGRGFSVAEQTAPTRSASVSAPAGTLGLDAVLALQGEPDNGKERRRRAARRGHELLDALDQLKLSVLNGRVSGSQLTALRHALAEQRAQTDDPQLDDLLAHIELRAEVELAKLARPAPR